jgi:hypothetical protein
LGRLDPHRARAIFQERGANGSAGCLLAFGLVHSEPDNPFLADSQPSSSRRPRHDVADAWECVEQVAPDEVAVEARLVFPEQTLFPAVEEEALTTRRASAAQIAVAVGLDAEAVRACAAAIGDAVRIVSTREGAAASDLVGVLRPRLVVAVSVLSDAEGGRLAAAATACGAQLLCLSVGVTGEAMAWAVQRAAAAAFGMAPLEVGPLASAGPAGDVADAV